ncbi:MAG: GNAT family N-acetyltransferase [Spirochaetes bacterium]|jgi:N-acetylglutamate synthase-like GNAT family acetyltransferase|nr:GNAT family N-acetyltransferase [Spirochaetota bacterium]
MISKLNDSDFEKIYYIINEAAAAYRGVIPDDRWKVPYMSKEELREQINEGVEFWGFADGGELIGVMGIQDKIDVKLIRHAYILTKKRRSGTGSILLNHLLSACEKPVLIGTWKAAEWAIDFYKKNKFQLLSEEEKNTLLKRYWKIPPGQVETSVVLADDKWLKFKKKRLFSVNSN